MPITTVFGVGTMEAAAEFVTIDLRITGSGDTVQKATAKAKTKLDALFEVIRKLDEIGATIGEDGMATSFSVQQRRSKDDRPIGYDAVFSADVRSHATDCAGEIFNLLSTVDTTYLGSPQFEISEATRQRLKNAAFKRAVEAAKQRFAFQCEVIGFDPADFEIVAWRYTGPNFNRRMVGKQLHVTQTETAVAGQNVRVECRVELTYDRVTQTA